MDTKAFAALEQAVARDLGVDPSSWIKPSGHKGVALCIIGAIYSTGNKHASVVNAINRYRVARRAQGVSEPDLDGPAELLEAAGGPDGEVWLVQHTNRCKASTKEGAPIKAFVALKAAQLLHSHGLESLDSVRQALSDPAVQRTSALKGEWIRLPSQSSGITWGYFLMLAGVDGVKPDRMIVSYVKRAIGRTPFSEEAADLIAAVAHQVGTRRMNLDHAIWRHQSGRPVFVMADRQ